MSFRTNPMSLRICILETDVLRPELTAIPGLRQDVRAAVLAAANCRRVSCVQRDERRLPADSEVFDAYLVTGSKADSFGTDAWIQTLKPTC